jgi:hypothetical protein
VKFLRQKGKLRTAVEANFTGYELLGEKQSLTPDLKNWDSDVLTLYASWNGKHPQLTLRNLVKQNFPQAVLLADLVPVDRVYEARNKADRSCQTSDRIYTFPVPIPSPLAAESVRWGEPEIKAVTPGELWHARLGHTGDPNMRATSETYPWFNIPKKHVTDNKRQPAVCECCAKCKATLKRKIKPSNTEKAKKYLERVHMDVCGPLQMKTYDGCQYFTVFVDEYTKYRWVYVHKDRTSSVEILKRWILDATKGTTAKVKCLRVDQAAEHLSKAFQAEAQRQEIRMEYSCPYDHWQNGRAEKAIRDINNMARCMIEYGKVARDMWGYAVRYAAYVQNRIVHAGMHVSPYEMRHRQTPDLTRLKVFGCTAYVTRDKKETDFVLDKKLDPRGAMGCFVGIAEDGGDFAGGAVKGYMVWTLETGARMLTTNQVVFDETSYPRLMGVTEWEFSLQAKVKKCKATVTVMSFETEEVDKHPFLFEQEELEYRKNQLETRLNPRELIGLEVTIKCRGQPRKGRIYNYLPQYKIWGIVLYQQSEKDSVITYVTASQLADENKIDFNEKLKLNTTKSRPRVGQEEDVDNPQVVDLRVIKLREEIDWLRYDCSVRETQTVIDRVVHVRAAKVKAAPISRHQPEPKTWDKAMETDARDKWYKAGEAEVNGLVDMETWDVVEPVPGVTPIDSKWVFKIKYTPTGEIEKYKARLVVRGDSQRAGLDFGEVFSPVAHNTICRMLLSMANACDFEIDLVDVCQAFLNAPLEEEIYMRPAKGVCDILGVSRNSWLKLKRNLYGLRQAPRNWSKTFINWMTCDQGFMKTSIDDCLYYKEFKHKGKDVFILLLMYVDDNIIISNDRECLDEFKKSMHAKFKIVDKGPISTYLGVQIERDRNKRVLKMHQEGYLNEVLAAMNIKKDNPLTYATPLPVGVSLLKNDGMPYELDLYRSAIGSLIYLSTWTRPDIAYAVSALAAHMSNPSREHHVALKHVLHYLHGTRDKGIMYHGNDIHGVNKLYGFCDADYAGNVDGRKSRSAYVMMMNSGCISWKSKLQTVIANSTTDAEVYAATLAIKEIVYLRDALRRIGLPQATEDAPNKGTLLYEDNQATTAIARSAAHREATKHIAIARCFLRYHQENGTVSVMDCYTHMQVADALTKPLGPQLFHKLVDEMMGVEEKKELGKFARRNWEEAYANDIEKLKEKSAVALNQLSVEQAWYLECSKQDHPEVAQGGMLKSDLLHDKKVSNLYVDVVYMNCMKLEQHVDGPNHIWCDSVEEYLRYEQHRSDLAQYVRQNDMKVENKYYGNVVAVNRLCVGTCTQEGH